MKKFWQWVQNKHDSGGERTLYLNGVIAAESWFQDDVTPQMFKEELHAGSGDITIWLNSPGGDFFAAAQIYNMLMDYPGDVTVNIDGIAASAASVIAMAGSRVYVSPVSQVMIHNPSTIAVGDALEMKRAMGMLDEVKESILNAYEIKTSMPRAKISRMMDEESWMNAKKAVELGFADDILFVDSKLESTDMAVTDGLLFSRQAVINAYLRKISKEETETGTPAESLYKRLDLISH